MDTFSEVFKNRKILDRILGILLILISVGIVMFLIPSLIPLIKRTPYQLLDPKPTIRHELGVDWIFQFIGWSLVYVTFRSGRAFLRDSKETTSARK
jgi:hypothetical protein